MKRMLMIGCPAALLVLAGCASAPGAPSGEMASATPDVVQIPAQKINALVKGMSAAHIREIMGPPLRTKLQPDIGPEAELWTYEVGTSQTVSQVTLTTQDAPTYDPLTGRPVNAKDAVYRYQRVTTHHLLHLLMLDGLLSSQKRGVEVERSFD